MSAVIQLLYGFDESGPFVTRENKGAQGALMDLSVCKSSDTPDEGWLTVSDGKNGRALWHKNDYGFGAGSSLKIAAAAGVVPAQSDILNRITGSSNLSTLYMPDSTALFDGVTEGTGFAFGVRIYFDGETGSGFGTDIHQIFGWWAIDGSLNEDLDDWPWTDTETVNCLGLALQPNTNVGPATAARLIWRWQSASITSINPNGTGWTDVGSTYGWDTFDTGAATDADHFIELNRWYRIICSAWQYDDGGTMRVMLRAYVYDETSNKKYIFDIASPAAWSEGSWGCWSSSFADGDLMFLVGANILDGDYKMLNGYADELWFREAPYDDPDDVERLIVSGISIPWTNPQYLRNPHDLRVAVASDYNYFPIPRELPIGQPKARHVVGVGGDRIKIKYEGFRAGRPWALRRVGIRFDSIGPWNQGKANNRREIDTLNIGVIRHPGRKPDGALAACWDIELGSLSYRRRRGYRVRRNFSDGVGDQVNNFYSWRSSSNELFRVAKIGDALVWDNGLGTALGTGFGAYKAASFADLDNRCIICSDDGQTAWDGTSALYDLEELPPTGGSAAVAAGGSLPSGVTFYYAYTFYDPATGDETAPKVITTGVTTSGGNQTANLTSLDDSPSNARFTQQRIYRTVADGAAPELFLIDTQNLATSYSDTGEPDGTDQVGVVTYGDGALREYIGLSHPFTPQGCVKHASRIFYWNGNTFWWSEPNEPLRVTQQYETADSPIRGMASRGSQLVVFTVKTVELFESDWARDSNGDYSIARTVASTNVGLLNRHSVIDHDDDLWWMDVRGIYRLEGDKVLVQSKIIENLFLQLNVGTREGASAAYNHFTNSLWFVAPFAELQADNNRAQTGVIVYPGGDNRFSFFRMDCTHVFQYDDDLNGIRFGAMDHVGTLREYESYEGDGFEGNEDGLEGTISAAPTGNTFTVSGTSPAWTTNEHVGKTVLLRSATTGEKFTYTIIGNGANTFEVAETPDADLITDDEFYMGGMLGEAEFHDMDFDTEGYKRVTDLKTEMADLTVARNW